MVNPRNKGSDGEREAAAWLQKNLNLEHTPQRNLEQVRFKGNGRVQLGMDLIGIEPFCIEIKRQEILTLRSWWIQCVVASKNIPGAVPVVMYRQNRKKWKFLISAKNLGLKNGFVQLGTVTGLAWLKIQLLEVSE